MSLVPGMEHAKILIVGTVPYNKATTARAFEAYFHGWKRECLAQIFSNSKKPVKGHCEFLLQITDKRMLQRMFDKDIQVEQCFTYSQLEEAWTDYDKEVGTGLYQKLYQWGAKKTPLIYLARGLLWQKKHWCTEALNRWLDDFSPDCVFLSFSDDFFIPQIALYAAQRFRIPIVSSIGDDYYFNGRFSLSPLYHIYKSAYRRLIRKVFAHGGSAIYISDKIRDKYNGEFDLNGETVYLVSELERKPFSPIDQKHPVISYFGNIRQGRSDSLKEIGQALGKLSPDYYLHVYSGQADERTAELFADEPNVVFCGSIPYEQVAQKTRESDILVIVEGFQPENIRATRYSLSTKAADSLASGAQILVYGPEECGVVSYMQSTGSAMVCTDRNLLEESIRTLIEDVDLQKRYYETAGNITKRNHTLENSTAVFRSVVMKAMEAYDRSDCL